MKKTIVTTALITCLLGISFSAFARNGDNAPKGWLLVRSGVASSDANYSQEKRDAKGKLQNVSVLCADAIDTVASVQQLISTDTTRTWTPSRGVSKVSAVNSLGGSVVINAVSGDPHHCFINGLTQSQIKSIWH